MKLFNKVLALLLALVLVVGLAACQTTPSTTPSGSTPAPSGNNDPAPSGDDEPDVDPADWSYPINYEKTITVWTQNRYGMPTETYRDGEPVWSDLERVVGVDIEWSGPVAGANVYQALELLWYEEELPMIVYGYIQASGIDQLVDDGLIWDLTDYMPTYAPDMWNYYQNELEGLSKQLVVSAEGRYAMAASVSCLEASSWIGPVIRVDWLEECNLDMPVTIEDWEVVLRAFKEKYNVQPLTFVLAYANNCRCLASGFNGLEFMGADLFRIGDEYQLGYLMPEWKDMMVVMNEWWEDGLIDHDMLSLDENALVNKLGTSQVGVAITSRSQYGKARSALESAGLDPDVLRPLRPPVAKEGDPTTATSIGASPIGNYNWVITTAATEEEMIACLKLLNYGFTEDGINMYNYGLEGENFEFAEDGSINWLRGADSRAYYKGGMASVSTGYLETEWERATVAAWTENTISDQTVMFDIPMTQEEVDQFGADWGEVADYACEEAIKFLTGARSLDEYDQFCEELLELNAQSCLDAWTSAYRRFLNYGVDPE